MKKQLKHYLQEHIEEYKYLVHDLYEHPEIGNQEFRSMRVLCKLLQKEVAKKDPATLEPWEAALINAMGADHDWVDAKELAPLLHFLGVEGEKAAY